ncbi:MAG: DUF5103 domain-containing protein, partial [Muribaculaceae bacterium]|nr:DUF5103 domain-containing protein [Muribaculaceae bacterium]
MVRRVALIALLACALRVAAAPADTMTGALNERLRTLQITDVAGLPAQMPVVTMDAPAQLGIEFDVLHDDRDYLRYRLVHCDASWRPSALAEAEYLDGFNEAEVENWTYSEATSVPYTHYRIDFPSPG